MKKEKEILSAIHGLYDQNVRIINLLNKLDVIIRDQYKTDLRVRTIIDILQKVKPIKPKTHVQPIQKVKRSNNTRIFAEKKKRATKRKTPKIHRSGYSQ